MWSTLQDLNEIWDKIQGTVAPIQPLFKSAISPKFPLNYSFVKVNGLHKCFTNQWNQLDSLMDELAQLVFAFILDTSLSVSR